jgi:hypothetical protein
VYNDQKGEHFDYLSEKRLDARRFNKWNNNSGGVHNKQGKLQNDAQVNENEVEGKD